MRKVERLVNLIALLLDTRRPLTLDQVAELVPGYDASGESLRRMFERDKEELRSLGVPVERAPIDAWGSEEGYFIDPEAYGMPELARALAAIQDDNGYMSDWASAGDGRFVISEHNCAIARVAGSWPTACAHELALFRQLAGPGVEVERVAHIQAGDPVCAYVLRAAEGNGRAAHQPAPGPPGP